MERFVRGDVVVLDFPFSNLLQVKRRPALVIKVPKGGDLIVNQITGKSQEPYAEVQINKKDFKEGGLKIDSYIRLDKLFSIEKSLISYKIGSLDNKKFDEILDKIVSFLRKN